MSRGTFSGEKTGKDNMVKELCIVKYVDELPKPMKRYVNKKIIK
jgi:hypothetical protein